MIPSDPIVCISVEAEMEERAEVRAEMEGSEVDLAVAGSAGWEVDSAEVAVW